ncbi:hypothetical protein ACB098_11G162900 [Castanea mollissima]
MAGAKDGRPSASLESGPWMPLSPGLGSQFRRPLSGEVALQLIKLLDECAIHIAADSMLSANICLEHISHFASADGDAIQRITAYFMEAFANKMLKNLPDLHKAFNKTKISSVYEEIHVQRLFFKLCLFLKVAYAVHIIDLYSFGPAQWFDLLQKLSSQLDGPPHLKITAIYENKEVLEQMDLQLTEKANNLNILFQFNPMVSKLENLDLESLHVKTGEALAISSVLQLHSLLATDEGMVRNSPVASKNRPKMESFVSSLRGLSPKLIVITEQEANHNGFTLMERVVNSFKFYAALFDCLDSTVSGALIDRQKIEKMLFGEEIKNIIACEGVERKETHEKLEKWILRLELAGFGRVHFSFLGMLKAKEILQSYDHQYNVKEENGCLVICWRDNPLFSLSAWR